MEWELTEGGRVLSASQGLTSAETHSSMAEGGDGRDPPTDLTCGPWREGVPDSWCKSLFWPIQAPTPGADPCFSAFQLEIRELTQTCGAGLVGLGQEQTQAGQDRGG